MKITVMDLALRLDISQQTVSYWMNKEQDIKKLFEKRGNKYVISERKIKLFKEKITRKRERIPAHLWSQTAIDCWERKMMCKGCMLEHICKQFEYPPIKKRVLENVRLYGEPKIILTT